MACSGRATAAIRSHDPELQVLHVQLHSVSSFPLLHTFQYLSGLYLSHILLTNTFYILLIFAHNQSLCSQVNHSALLSLFFIFISQHRTSSDPDVTSWMQIVLRFTGIWYTLFARLTTLLQVAKQAPGKRKMLLVKFRDLDNTRKCWLWDMEAKTRDKRNPEVYQYHTQNYSCLSLDE